MPGSQWYLLKQGLLGTAFCKDRLGDAHHTISMNDWELRNDIERTKNKNPQLKKCTYTEGNVKYAMTWVCLPPNSVWIWKGVSGTIFYWKIVMVLKDFLKHALKKNIFVLWFRNYDYSQLSSLFPADLKNNGEGAVWALMQTLKIWKKEKCIDGCQMTASTEGRGSY